MFNLFNAHIPTLQETLGYDTGHILIFIMVKASPFLYFSRGGLD